MTGFVLQDHILQLLMKMLMITNRVTSEYFHTDTYLIDFFPKLHYCNMRQQCFWDTCLFNNCFISYFGLCICFIFWINCFFQGISYS